MEALFPVKSNLKRHSSIGEGSQSESKNRSFPSILPLMLVIEGFCNTVLIPAGTRVELEHASSKHGGNLPEDSPIKWWATILDEPLVSLVESRGLHETGIGLYADDVRLVRT